MPKLFTDEAKVAQILRNLISNALKFTEQGEVRVTARHDACEKMRNIQGSRHRHRHRRRNITTASSRNSRRSTRDCRRSVKGTGLGLPLSRSLAQLLGGDLTVESVLGQGSVFTLVIPVQFRDPKSAVLPAADLTQKRVLLIDDDETFRYVMRQIIGNEPRYEFIEAGDGERRVAPGARETAGRHHARPANAECRRLHGVAGTERRPTHQRDPGHRVNVDERSMPS